ncbi:hypothetical protein TCDM_12129 [Trypanosoma cruzi Dm28c]|uniref:Uncharacterized protein n=1 Tax=Trypanosoma cruzi Dm28c TaxID=1416333 RepID=V5AYP2_TRYCR|nr:hypothetical protein TCDM_12129 [Trypanosoma cruzi Dm28c]
MDERISTAIHSEWHYHPRRSHSQQQLTHTDTRNETEEQCTGNTQRLPPATGVTAGVLFVTRQRTPSNTEQRPHTKQQQTGCKAAKPHFAAIKRCHRSFYYFLPAHAPQPPQAHITPHRRKIPRRQIHSKRDTSARAAAGREAIRTRTMQSPTPLTGCAPPTSHPQHVEKTYRSLPISLLTRAAAARPCACVRHSMSVWACVFVSAYTCKAAVRHKRLQRKAMTKREANRTHANYSYHHAHAHNPQNGCTQPQHK